GIGAKVIHKAQGETQLLEQQPTRGFESSVDTRLHFGLGKATRIDSLTVIWPDRRFQILTNVAANRLLTLSQSDATAKYVYPRERTSQLFDKVTSEVEVTYKRQETLY